MYEMEKFLVYCVYRVNQKQQKEERVREEEEEKRTEQILHLCSACLKKFIATWLYDTRREQFNSI